MHYKNKFLRSLFPFLGCPMAYASLHSPLLNLDICNEIGSDIRPDTKRKGRDMSTNSPCWFPKVDKIKLKNPLPDFVHKACDSWKNICMYLFPLQASPGQSGQLYQWLEQVMSLENHFGIGPMIQNMLVLTTKSNPTLNLENWISSEDNAGQTKFNWHRSSTHHRKNNNRICLMRHDRMIHEKEY